MRISKELLFAEKQAEAPFRALTISTSPVIRIETWNGLHIYRCRYNKDPVKRLIMVKCSVTGKPINGSAIVRLLAVSNNRLSLSNIMHPFVTEIGQIQGQNVPSGCVAQMIK